MQQSYTKNYIKIYFFQVLSILLGFASLFVVVPYISSDKEVYGIYSICISITVFLSYADLGFLGAAQKFAAEAFSQGNKQKEVALLGFAHFILLCVVLLIGCLFLYFSFTPTALIAGLKDAFQINIAHQLLLILALSTPVVVLQRLAQMIFSIRLEEYNVQKLVIVGNLIKILSVFYFFTGGRYDIIGYYLFLQIVSAIVALCSILLAKKRYDYPIGALIKKLKFSKEIFLQTKTLAFSSLFVTVAWILYYELDSITIGKMLGAEQVAIYAIGLTLLGFVRSMFGVLFSPFASRFNHFVGLGQTVEYKRFYLHVLKITFPLVVFSLVAVVIMSKAIVVSWVGDEYLKSTEVVRWLVLCNVLAFVSYPAGMMLVANQQIKQMYLLSVVMVVVFWGGIFSTVSFWGIESFARFKFLAFFVSGLMYIWLSSRFLQISLWQFLKQIVFPYVPAIAVMSILLFFVNECCVDGKNKLYLLINAGIVLAGIVVAMFIAVFTVPDLRVYAIKVLHTLKKR